MFQRKNTITQELSRKGAHIFLALIFAYIAPQVSTATLVQLAVVLAVCFAVYRKVFDSKKHLFFVPRKSYGEFFFALGVGVSALLAGGDTQLFQLSMLVLGLADSLSALVGMHYGRCTFRVFGEERTAEGSGVFALATFLLTLLFGFGVFPALFVATIVTAVEALSVRGSDNFFIPISVVGVLTLFF